VTGAAAAARAVIASSDDPDSLRALPGFHLVQWKEGRAVLLGRLGDRAVFVKRFSRSRAKEGRAEAEAYGRLAAAGVPAAALLADVEEKGVRALVLEDAGPGLDEVAALEGNLPAKLRLRLAKAASTVRTLHAAGFRFPDLLARHLRVGADGEVRLIDLARLSMRGDRAVDLGAFFGTLPRLAVPERARLRFFAEATADLSDRRPLARKVIRETAKTRNRSRNRRHLLEIDPAHRDALGPLPLADGNPGERLRQLKDRENRRITAGGAVYFMKRHFAGSDAAITELEGALAFRRAGVPAALPAAYGASFWVAAAAPGMPLDEQKLPDRAALARVLGGHAGRMRRAGIFHRDFYLNHWIGRWSREKGWELTLIDLQRWGRIGLRSERWFVKDAAALWHSARRTAFTRTDAVRFLRACFGIPRLDRRAKSFAKAVVRKSAAMARHRPRTPVS
jgi:tRNA A-37 threonylcarbamoyl transferase component Bud32